MARTSYRIINKPVTAHGIARGLDMRGHLATTVELELDLMFLKGILFLISVYCSRQGTAGRATSGDEEQEHRSPGPPLRQPGPRQRLRRFDAPLPFTMCAVILAVCVLLYLGRRLNAAIDLRMDFGDYLPCTAAETDYSMWPRVEGTATLLPQTT